LANTDPSSQAYNAGRNTEKRVVLASLSVTPEQEDAEDLERRLDPEISLALKGASKELPKGEQFDSARSSQLLSMQARHDLIIRLRAQGMRPDRIARSLGIGKKTVDNVVKAYFSRVEGELRAQRMDEFILMMAEGYLEDMDRLSDVVARSTQSSAVVGAIRARQDAREKYVNLLADFGFINRKPTELNITGDGATVDARTQNVIVMSQEQIRAITKELLQQKRIAKKQPADPQDDDRIATLVVTADDIS
jgi:hypothetical protein